MSKGIFVTGTDTAVGKTVVAAALAGAIKSKGIDVGVMKPVATGAVMTKDGCIPEDVRFLRKSVACDNDVNLVNPVAIELPLAPLVAARLSQVHIELNKIQEAYSEMSERHDFVVVEGIGGILVPIREDYFVSHMIADLGLPTVVVAGPRLGTINHTLLTIREAQYRGIEVRGFIINETDGQEGGAAERTTPEVIRELSRTPFLGAFPFDPKVDVSRLEMGDIIALALNHIEIEKILA